MKKKILYGIYIVCGLGGCLFLFLSMFLKQSKIEMEANAQTNSEQSSPAEQMDQYLSKNFGLRTEVISFYTKFQDQMFSTSFVDNVVIGKEGFLYYKDTIDDYCGTNKMSSRETDLPCIQVSCPLPFGQLAPEQDSHLFFSRHSLPAERPSL